MAVLSPRRVVCLALGLLASLSDATVSASSAWKDFQVQKRTAAECPDYNKYAQQPHAPYSDGPLKLPYMRPSEECRTFKSPAVEVSIHWARIKGENEYALGSDFVANYRKLSRT